MFWLVDTGNPVLISLAFWVALVAWSAMYGPMGALFSELFGTRVQLLRVLFELRPRWRSGDPLTLLIAAWFLSATGASWSVSLYLFAMALIKLRVCITALGYQPD